MFCGRASMCVCVCACGMCVLCMGAVVPCVSGLPNGSDLGAAIMSKALLIHPPDWSDKSFIKPLICHLCHWRLGQHVATLETHHRHL